METRLELDSMFPGNTTLQGSREKELPKDLFIPLSCLIVVGISLIIILLIICSVYLEEAKTNDSSVISSAIFPNDPIPMIKGHKVSSGISDFCKEQKIKVAKSTSMPLIV